MADYILVHGGNMTTETWNRLNRGTPVNTPDGTMGGRIWEPGHFRFLNTIPTGFLHRPLMTNTPVP